jgi:hypothetical protein
MEVKRKFVLVPDDFDNKDSVYFTLKL